MGTYLYIYKNIYFKYSKYFFLRIPEFVFVCFCFFLIKLNFGFTRTISHLASVVFIKTHKQKETNKKKTKARICMRTHLVELKKKKKNPCFYIFFFPIFLFIILGIVVDMIWLHRPYFLFFFLSFAPPSSYYWRPLEVFFSIILPL
jgi:hypothetical protein